MTELELYKFINDNSVEWHRQDNDGTPDIILFPFIFQIEEFNKLFKGYISDGGVECVMMDGYFAFWMQDICNHYGIDSDKVFCGEEK